MELENRSGRSMAIAALVAAGTLAALVVSLAGGTMPPPALLDALSIGTAATALVVVVLAYAGLGAGPWVQAGRSLAISGMTLVLVGDGLQAVATRGGSDSGMLWAVSFAVRDGIGNGLFFASLLVLGGLLWSRHGWLAGLAVANGVLGFLEMAFAARLGLPPHTNFLLLVVWFVILGATWWRAAASDRVTAPRASTEVGVSA